MARIVAACPPASAARPPASINFRRWSGSWPPSSSSSSTALVSGADPEVVRRRMTRFFDEVSHGIETHGGFVEKYAGDAVLAVFGVPQAHEDDAERAVRAALAIQESVRELELEA